MRKLLNLLLCMMLVLIAVPSVCSAYTFTGELRQDDGTLAVPNGGYADSVFTWTVDDITNPGFWTYQYNFTNNPETGRDISHIDIEVSSDFNLNLLKEAFFLTFADKTVWPELDGTDLISWASDFNIGEFEGAKTFNESGINIFGIKWEPDGDTKNLMLTLVTPRGPMWGDMHVKDGQEDKYVRNLNFGTDPPPTDLITNGNNGGRALVPDTGTALVPIPSAVWLLASGLIGLAGFRRKLRKR